MPRSLCLFSTDSPEWAAFLERTDHDFFHTAAYHRSSQAAGEGDACLALYRDRDRFLAWPHLLRRIRIEGDLSGLRDVTSTYGYVGPVACGCSEDPAFLAEAWNALVQFWRKQNVVSVFTRFHPLLRNHPLAEHFDTSASVLGVGGGLCLMGKTVAIDLLSPAQQVWKDYKRQLRQHIQRAEHMGLVSIADPAWNRLADFIRLYYSTMQRNRSAPFYLFTPEYFERLRCALNGHGTLMLTWSGDQLAAAGLFIEYGAIVTAHLVGSNDDCYQLSPSKVLLHHAHLWARERGNRLFHIGGGRGANADDALFRFKSEFSQQHYCYFAGKWILDQERYDLLSEQRAKEAAEAGCELDQRFFPLYRASFRPLSVPALPPELPAV